MTEDPIKSYQDALRDYNTATEQAKSIAQTIAELAKILQEWEDVIVADGKTQFPVGVGKYSINPKDFPTIQQIAETLSHWHKARHDLKNKWFAIPDDRRTGLISPDFD